MAPWTLQVEKQLRCWLSWAGGPGSSPSPAMPGLADKPGREEVGVKGMLKGGSGLMDLEDMSPPKAERIEQVSAAGCYWPLAPQSERSDCTI